MIGDSDCCLFLCTSPKIHNGIEVCTLWWPIMCLQGMEKNPLMEKLGHPFAMEDSYLLV